MYKREQVLKMFNELAERNAFHVSTIGENAIRVYDSNKTSRTGWHEFSLTKDEYSRLQVIAMLDCVIDGRQWYDDKSQLFSYNGVSNFNRKVIVNITFDNDIIVN